MSESPKMNQIEIPETTPQRYITGKAALNLPAPEGTSGDWHFVISFYDPANSNKPLSLLLAGEGEQLNTNPIYGEYGIYECSEAMRRRNLILPEGMTAVYAANHFRAILDMVYNTLTVYQRVVALQGATEDWLDTEEQKEELLKEAAKMLPFFADKAQRQLQQWIDQERKPGYRS